MVVSKFNLKHEIGLILMSDDVLMDILCLLPFGQH